MFARGTHLTERVLGAVDLAIDIATLGEYGLEPCSADEPRRERPGRKTGWEALLTARPRRACGRAEAGDACASPAPATRRGAGAFPRHATLPARRRSREAA